MIATLPQNEVSSVYDLPENQKNYAAFQPSFCIIMTGTAGIQNGTKATVN